MRTDILNPKDLFHKDVRYTIPAFQRSYVWTKNEQWEPLWDDVRNLAEEYLEKLESGMSNVEAEQATKPHFLGALVIQQVPTATKDIDQRDVIDGQQRMTTIQLLLDAVQLVFEETGASGAARRLSRFVINDIELVEDTPDYTFKLWPTLNDREAFRHAMDNGLAINEFEESQIVRAHDFFQSQVRQWLGDGASPQDSKVEALETAVATLLNMVVIDLNLSEDPHIIFETLNARGTPLNQSELIKNFVMARSPAGSNSGLDIWGNLGDSWWQGQARQGRLLRNRLDMLLNHWIAMSTGMEVAPSSVFNAFRGYVEERALVDVMGEVQKDLGNYKRYQQSRESYHEEQFYHRTDVMQMGVITPVLLRLLSAESSKRIKALQALESFLVRRMICKQTTKDYNHLVLELAVRLGEPGLERADTIVPDFLKEQTANSREWPSDDAVTNALGSLPLYQLLTRGRLRLVLEGIEERLRSSMSEQANVPGNLTIEHIMPQSWGAHWPMSKQMDTDDARRERNRLIHTIGNLTLVTQRLNSSVRNDPWEAKRKTLLGHAVLKLNGELMSETRWDEDRIRDRSLRMAKMVTEIWPGPDSPVWCV